MEAAPAGATGMERSAAIGLPAAVQRRARWWVELLAVAWLALLYDMVTGLAPLREALALSHGRAVLSLEHSLDLDPELSFNHWLTSHHVIGLVASYYYDNAHFVVTFGLLAWLWWRRADLYRPLRSSLVLVNLIGLAIFWLYPVAPPRMLNGDGFTDVIAASHTFGSWHTGSLAADADQLAAMPSLHIAWAAWCALALWRMSARWPLRTLAVLYPCMTAIVVLATGNHYLLDVVAGLGTFALAGGLVGTVTKLLRSRRSW